MIKRIKREEEIKVEGKPRNEICHGNVVILRDMEPHLKQILAIFQLLSIHSGSLEPCAKDCEPISGQGRRVGVLVHIMCIF